jgi:iron(III) transport system substrate-binding protein
VKKRRDVNVKVTRLILIPIAAMAMLLAAACGTGAAPAQPAQAPQAVQPTAAPQAGGTLTVYSGRNEKLIAPLVERFGKETGIEVKVRYGDTAELAAAILEEGKNSPADLYFGQDGGALGALAKAGRLSKLPTSLLDRVDPRFRGAEGNWLGISGRARTVVYNTQELKEVDLPDSVLDFADPRWKGKIGWAPTNGSFQAFVTAMRITAGEEAARKWLEGVKANDPKVYKNNTAIVQAVGAGEVQVGFVNHYYLFSSLREQGESFPVRNYHPRAGDAGAMINVAGVGILDTARNSAGAERFVDYLLSRDAQGYFAAETFEYPVVPGIETHPMVSPMSEINAPAIDLARLEDLEKTLKLLQETGVL